jgi:pilus assembly protein CpaD
LIVTGDRKMNMKKSAILIAFALGVSACGTENRGLESIHQPVVSRADYNLDVWTGPTGLANGDAQRLTGWFESLQLGYGDRVSVDMGGAYDSSNVRQAIADIAARYGLLLQEAAPLTQGEIPQGAARVVVSRLKASVPGCPDWSRPSIANMGGHTTPNFGCATNTNLAAMVADPEDLIRGKTGHAADDVLTAGKAIESYRKAPPTGVNGLKTERAGER